MSERNDIISVTPPGWVYEDNMKENITSRGHLCSYCHGNGFFWNEVMRERVKTACPVCRGSGRLDAEITITWKPAGKPARADPGRTRPLQKTQPQTDGPETGHEAQGAK